MSRKRRSPKAKDQDPFWNEYGKLLLTSSPVFAALIFLALLNHFWKGPISPTLLGLTFFAGGFTGFIIVVRREFPAVLFRLRGVPAIALGGLVLLFFWGSAVYIILQALL
ncbi:MAG TPA: hypothetical protein VLZ89_11915 [Anaerolineales bacterium]|nr:hypothetical protein [Anaerolineales bacterium]